MEIRSAVALQRRLDGAASSVDELAGEVHRLTVAVDAGLKRDQVASAEAAHLGPVQRTFDGLLASVDLASQRREGLLEPTLGSGGLGVSVFFFMQESAYEILLCDWS